MTVYAESLANLQVQIRAGSHDWIADEPLGQGGTDAGPGPFDLLLGSLVACTSITLHMYAQRKEWPLEKVELRVDMRNVKASECEDCDSPPNARVNIIELKVTLHGDLDEAQRARLHEIAQRCPVHRTLLSEIKIRTNLIIP